MKRIFETLKQGILPRLKIFLPLAAVGIILPFCMGNVEQHEYIYMLLNDTTPQTIYGRPTAEQSFDGLHIVVDDHAADAQLVLDEGQEIPITRNGQTCTATTRRETVDHLLKRMDIVPAEDEMIILRTEDGISIDIDDELQVERQHTIDTTYNTERVLNPLLEKGTERVKQEGVAGAVIQTYVDTYHMGKVEQIKLVDETSDTAVTEIVEYGSLVYSVDRDDYIVDVHPNAEGSGGYLTFASGDTMTYSYVTTCNATAYSGGWGTASGYPVGVGNIAVDTSVFPFGTRMFVETVDGSWVYGMAVARDTGSGINGYELDLWFTSYDTACSFGRRDCTVYVLN